MSCWDRKETYENGFLHKGNFTVIEVDVDDRGFAAYAVACLMTPNDVNGPIEIPLCFSDVLPAGQSPEEKIREPHMNFNTQE
jgi:hypothetical protein